MTDDVVHSTQHFLKYINRAISANLRHRPLKLGRANSSVPKATCSVPVPTHIVSNFQLEKPLNEVTNSS